MPEVFVGRQPIYNRKLDVYAYELLFRDAADAAGANVRDGDQATSQVILNTFLDIGAEQVVGSRLAFLNLTRGFIVGEYPLPFSPEQVVLEVLEGIEPDEDVLAGLTALAEQGFTIALDDYFHKDELQPLVELADIIKVDCLGLSADEVARQVDVLARHGVKLLAEKVESIEEFEHFERLGFDYFQGYFLCKPRVVRGRRVPANRLGVLQLLSKLHDPAVQFEDLEDLISQDVALSYKLFRHVNSALYAMPRKIESVRETLVILGMDKVRSIVSLVLLSGLDDKPHDLFLTSLLRAKMCELLARAAGRPNPDAYFTTGLFSSLDAVMDAPLGSLLEKLPLAPEIRDALLAGDGDLGQALACVQAYERGHWSGARYADLAPSVVKSAFLAAVDRTNQIDRELFGSAPGASGRS